MKRAFAALVGRRSLLPRASRVCALPLAPIALVGALSGCGAASAASGPGGVTAVRAPDLELRDANGAVLAGKAIAMDGIAEGLAWPALRDAVARKPGDHAPLTIAVGRAVPLNLVLRAVWTLRDADVRLQTPDPAGVVHALDLRPKPDAPAAGAEAESVCHLAVFVASDGALRVALPGGPRVVHPPDAASALGRAIASERAQCTLRYVAFGAEKGDVPWSAVFDVAETIDREKSAGDARYVLAEPIQATPAAH
jgi:hypothetical protein